MADTIHRLTEPGLPGMRRAWRDLVPQLADLPEGDWALMEEGAQVGRADGVRKSLTYYEGIEVAQRKQPDGTYNVYARREVKA